MKQYLKMADEFDLPVLAEIQRADFSVISSPLGEVIGGFAIASHSTAAAHAINSHDELVQMNQELLAALKQVVGDVRALADHSYGVHGLHQNGDLAPWNSLFSGGFFESWLLSVDDADAVIAKTEGGAA